MANDRAILRRGDQRCHGTRALNEVGLYVLAGTRTRILWRAAERERSLAHTVKEECMDYIGLGLILAAALLFDILAYLAFRAWRV